MISGLRFQWPSLFCNSKFCNIDLLCLEYAIYSFYYFRINSLNYSICGTESVRMLDTRIVTNFKTEIELTTY